MYVLGISQKKFLVTKIGGDRVENLTDLPKTMRPTDRPTETGPRKEKQSISKASAFELHVRPDADGRATTFALDLVGAAEEARSFGRKSHTSGRKDAI